MFFRLYLYCFLITFSLVGQAKSIVLWRTLTAPDEMAVFDQQLTRYNQLNPNMAIKLESIPHGNYRDSVIGGALAKDLPCILAVDQPDVANYAWSGLIRPLYLKSATEASKQLISQQTIARINPSGVGDYQGNIYSLGPFDIALALFTRKSLIKKLNLRIPTVEKPWTLSEFNQVLQKIKQLNYYKYTFNMNLLGVGEWSSYAYLPMLYSAGSDLINRDHYLSAEGILNNQAAQNWGRWLQWLIAHQLTPVQTGEHALFERGKVAIEYNGSWVIDRYKKSIGDDLLILPTIDFGQGLYIGGGSWHFSITSECKRPRAAARFIEFIMSDQEIKFFSDHTGFIPTSATAAKKTKLYNKNGELNKLYQMSAEHVVMRPATPGYPAISNVFAQAVRRITDGENVEQALDRAVDEIDRNISDNRGYK